MTTLNFTRFYIVLAMSIIALSSNTTSAQTLKLNPKMFTMTILGTTNVHNFESKVTQASGELVLTSDKKLQSMLIEIPVKGIKSKEKLMDTKTYEAFTADKNPIITFKATELNSFQITGADLAVTVTGNLTMAGTTRKITLKATGKTIKPGVYQFKGSLALKMTDFKMSPPTAMLGMMKVGDAITLKYEVSFEGAAIN